METIDIKKVCCARPSLWEAKTLDGRHLFVRSEDGEFELVIDFDNGVEVTYEHIYEEGSRYNCWEMEEDDMLEIVNKLPELPLINFLEENKKMKILNIKMLNHIEWSAETSDNRKVHIKFLQERLIVYIGNLTDCKNLVSFEIDLRKNSKEDPVMSTEKMLEYIDMLPEPPIVNFSD